MFFQKRTAGIEQGVQSMIPEEVAKIIDILEKWYGVREDFEYHQVAWDIYNALDFCQCD